MADINVSNHLPGAIKSVQHGVTTISTGATVSVTIAEVNPDRCFLVLHSAGNVVYNGFTSSTSFELENLDYGYARTMSWQVVEYY